MSFSKERNWENFNIYYIQTEINAIELFHLLAFLSLWWRKLKITVELEVAQAIGFGL